VILGAFILIFIQHSVNLAKDELKGILDPNQIISLTQIAIGMLIILILIYLPEGVRKEPKITSSHIEHCIKPKKLKIIRSITLIDKLTRKRKKK
jgi:hypothetical protein